MARPKKFEGQELVPYTFKMPTELKSLFVDYAFSCGQKPVDILIDLIDGLTTAGAKKIEAYRRQKNSGVKATFAEPTPSKKSARTAKKKKNPAQVADSPTGEGDVTNENT